jgi:hypothetical protein
LIAVRSRRLAVAALGLALAAAGCSRRPPDASPDGALRVFLDELDAADDDATAVGRAYDLLGPGARDNLAERAPGPSRS